MLGWPAYSRRQLLGEGQELHDLRGQTARPMCLRPVSLFFFLSSRRVCGCPASRLGNAWEYYQHFSPLTPSWVPKQVAQHHIQKMIDISPLLCESLLSTPAAAVGTIHNLCLFTEIIANSFMERLLCVFLPIYRFDYIVCRMETWLSTAYSHSHRSSRREDPFKNKMVRTCTWLC